MKNFKYQNLLLYISYFDFFKFYIQFIQKQTNLSSNMTPVGFNFFIAKVTGAVEIKGVGILKAIKF